ncbi:hypothetical protein [Streptomyces fuscichromogenes]|uniref:hypothetical protein n=1 Tax=Streptomyces fuscichromogenes TaxID=1324013 RepID=UPI0016702CE7|nr:hypothetical protein [Streptomyces fuscichromogenes]
MRPLLQRFRAEFGGPDTTDVAVRYVVLRSALAARVGDWPEAVRRCPGRSDLHTAATGVVHALAVSALRRLAEDGGRHAEAGTAALAIVLWAYLLDEEDRGGFRALLAERRGAPVPDELWEDGRRHLSGRITDLLHSLDVRSGRDALAAWVTAWEAESVTPSVVPSSPSDAGPDALLPLGLAARHLVGHGRRLDLLDSYTARHPDPATWAGDSPDHRACADALAQALAEQGQDRARAKEWSEALTDYSAAARLGHILGVEERKTVFRAGKNVGRTSNGHGNSPIARILGLELAHELLLPEDGSLAGDLTAELVLQGQRVFASDPRQSRNRFARALVVSPTDREARSGLDDHLRADLHLTLDGAEPGEKVRATAVRGLLRRDPDCAPARAWLRGHYTGRAVTAASRGDAAAARSAVRGMIRHVGGVGPYGKERVDDILVDLLVDAARSAGAAGTRAGMERRVDLLGAAVDFAGPTRGHVREKHDEAVLHLAEHLEAMASPSDVIELFLRDRMRTGVSARFDQTVQTAYLRRAKAREADGDLGRAQRDRASAARIGAGLPDQGLLFGPVPRPRRDDDCGQETLF